MLVVISHYCCYSSIGDRLTVIAFPEFLVTLSAALKLRSTTCSQVPSLVGGWWLVVGGWWLVVGDDPGVVVCVLAMYAQDSAPTIKQ